MVISLTDAITLSGEDSQGFSSSIFNLEREPAQGNSGSIILNTSFLSLKDEATVSASTLGEGSAGNVSITTQNLTVESGAEISAITVGTSNAGNITLKVQDNLTLSGEGSGLFANTEEVSSGNGGSIFIDPKTVIVQDRATIAVNSEGSGAGGDIFLRANSLILDNDALISGETASNLGSNINLQVEDFLLLRRGSNISANVGTALAGGEGGNFIIDAGFIVAVPDENSDISANAFEGKGGNINIDTNGIFGIEFRGQKTPLSDITASGTVTLNTPNVDPTRGLNNLPQEAVEAEVAQSCQETGSQSTLEFFDVGRGGLPPTPDDLFSSEVVIAEWIPLDFTEEKIQTPASEKSFTGDEIKNMTLLTNIKHLCLLKM